MAYFLNCHCLSQAPTRSPRSSLQCLSIVNTAGTTAPTRSAVLILINDTDTRSCRKPLSRPAQQLPVMCLICRYKCA